MPYGYSGQVQQALQNLAGSIRQGSRDRIRDMIASGQLDVARKRGELELTREKNRQKKELASGKREAFLTTPMPIRAMLKSEYIPKGAREKYTKYVDMEVDGPGGGKIKIGDLVATPREMNKIVGEWVRATNKAKEVSETRRQEGIRAVNERQAIRDAARIKAVSKRQAIRDAARIKAVNDAAKRNADLRKAILNSVVMSLRGDFGFEAIKDSREKEKYIVDRVAALTDAMRGETRLPNMSVFGDDIEAQAHFARAYADYLNTSGDKRTAIRFLSSLPIEVLEAARKKTPGDGAATGRGKSPLVRPPSRKPPADAMSIWSAGTMP